MQSPYVLNSNVVDYRRTLHKPLSYNKDSAKMTLQQPQTDPVMAIFSDAHYLQSAFSHRYLMSPLGGGISLPSVNNINLQLVRLVLDHCFHNCVFNDKQHRARQCSTEVALLKGKKRSRPNSLNMRRDHLSYQLVLRPWSGLICNLTCTHTCLSDSWVIQTYTLTLLPVQVLVGQRKEN